MESCSGCQREFKSLKSLNSHKRFCQAWQDLGQSRAKRTIPLKERKQKTADCPNCGKTFKNVYSMSSHKGHCIGLNDYESRSQEAKDRMAWSRGKILADHKDIFCENSQYETGYAKKAFLRMSDTKYECTECQASTWCGKELVLELDHINGDNQDHRLENIRLLCPNCHSQTHNWRGRNKNSGRVKVTDDQLLKALQNKSSIRQALLSVGLAAKGGNYNRCKKLLSQL